MDRFIYREKRETQKNTQVNSIWNDLLGNVLAKIILVSISIFLVYNIFHSVNITVQKLDIPQRARVEVDSLRFKNLELAILLDKMQSSEYLEVQARDRLNFAGEKEYVFVIPEKVLEDMDDSLVALLEGERCEDGVEVFDIWIDFLVRGI